MIPILIALLIGLPAAAYAQVIRGVVRDSASGAPVSGVLVALLDPASGARRTTLTDETGRFALAAAGAGSFTLETKRIGVRPAVTPAFSLAAGEMREIELMVAPVVARLAAVRVTGKSYCADRLREGGETASLWEEARAALLATRVTRESQRFLVTIARFKRTYHPKRLEIMSEDRSEQTGLASNPFTSVPVAELAAKGYIAAAEGGALMYHAPDVDVLLSDMFVRDHCFRLVTGTGTNADMIGVAFQPTSARRLPDIAGVLWLDAATRELRRMEFNYTEDPYEGLWQRFPSYMDYMRLPSGAWIIRRWAIRMPLVQISRPDVTIPGGGGAGATRRVVGILEEGAEATLDDGRRRVPRALVGVVVDSSTGAAVRGATVSLRGTPFSATADDAGRFRITVPDSGLYLIAFSHPRLDSLGYEVRAQPIRLVDSLTVVDLAVPPFATIRAELCPGSPAGAPTSVVVGLIRTAAGRPAAWTTIRYRWQRMETLPSNGAAAPVLQSSPGATFVTDSHGRYLICDVPPGRYRLSLESEIHEAAEVDLFVESGKFVASEVRLARGT